jgi:hypothetical protein
LSHSIRILFVTFVVLLFGCAPLTLGRPFGADPALEIKAGHDLRKDVIGKMGQPFRRGVDSRGREIFTYVWADGVGGGSKCLIAFNKNGVVSLVEVTP